MVPVNEQTSADIAHERAERRVEGGGCPMGSEKASRKGVIYIEKQSFTF